MTTIEMVQVVLLYLAIIALLIACIEAVRMWHRPRRGPRMQADPASDHTLDSSRYVLYGGGRAMGRSAAMTATQAALDMPQWRYWTSTSTVGEGLTQADLQRAYANLVEAAPREPQMIAQARWVAEQRRLHELEQAKEQARRDAEELNKALAEPFWAWHDRREG